MPRADYVRLSFPGADDMANMFRFKRDFNAEFCAARNVADARALHPGLSSFDDWLRADATRLPIPQRAVA